MQGRDKPQCWRLNFESGRACPGVSSFAHWSVDLVPAFPGSRLWNTSRAFRTAPAVRPFTQTAHKRRDPSFSSKPGPRAPPTCTCHSDRKWRQTWVWTWTEQDSHEHRPLAFKTGLPTRKTSPTNVPGSDQSPQSLLWGAAKKGVKRERTEVQCLSLCSGRRQTPEKRVKGCPSLFNSFLDPYVFFS